jgi:hypothetical protein
VPLRSAGAARSGGSIRKLSERGTSPLGEIGREEFVKVSLESILGYLAKPGKPKEVEAHHCSAFEFNEDSL